MSIIELKVRCNGWFWLAASVGLFFFLAQWQTDIPYGPPGTSLVELMRGALIAFWKSRVAEGTGYLAVAAFYLVPLYLVVSAGLGWIIAATASYVLAAVRVIVERTSSARKKP